MAGGQCRGLQSHPPAFLDIPSMTVDEFQRLMPSFEAAIQAPMGLCAPSIIAGCPSHFGTRWFNRDKLISRESSLWLAFAHPVAFTVGCGFVASWNPCCFRL